jgi:hypothetical protein
MLTVTFAFVVATALFFFFRQTRWMGVVGVFVLLCINPLVFGSLLLLAGLVCYLKSRRPTYEVLPSERLLSDRTGKRRHNVVLLLSALGVGGALALGYSEPTSDSAVSQIIGAVRSAPRDEVLVLRTPGGLLEVSTIQTTELFDATVKHSVFGIEIGETAPRIRVPATYRFHVELEPEWRVVRSDGVFTLVAPRIRPSLPVAVDFAGMQKDVAGAWILLPFTSTKAMNTLERSITAKLAQKAGSRDYIDRQREDARETVREFARKWLVEQTRWKRADYEDIRVLFADEPAGAIAPLSG